MQATKDIDAERVRLLREMNSQNADALNPAVQRRKERAEAKRQAILKILFEIDADEFLRAMDEVIQQYGADFNIADLKSRGKLDWRFYRRAKQSTLTMEEKLQQDIAIKYVFCDCVCVWHALKGLACRKRVAAASSPAATCKQDAALTSPARHACGCARPSRALLCHKQ